MAEHHSDVEIPEARGLRAHLAVPKGDERMPGVVVLHEIFGLNDDVRSHTDRLAGAGYLTVAPDLYSGRGGRPRCVLAALRSMARGRGSTHDDIDAVRRWLETHPRCDGRVAAVGFCMGGGFALALASSGFAAAAPCYGRVPEDAEVQLAGACPMVASFGADDVTLRGHAERLRAALEKSGVAHDVRVYPGASHSFMNRHVGPAALLDRVMRTGYRPEAAEDAWARILAFFDTHLRADDGSARNQR